MSRHSASGLNARYKQVRFSVAGALVLTALVPVTSNALAKETAPQIERASAVQETPVATPKRPKAKDVKVRSGSMSLGMVQVTGVPSKEQPVAKGTVELVKDEVLMVEGKPTISTGQSDQDYTDSGFALPLKNYSITSRFGKRADPWGGGGTVGHVGLDLATACGSPVYASAAGTVVRAENTNGHSGIRVDIQHATGIYTGYSHNSALKVQVGDRVQQGQLIALAGTTGNSTGCHVHFEVIQGTTWLNPWPFLFEGKKMVEGAGTTGAAGRFTERG